MRSRTVHGFFIIMIFLALPLLAYAVEGSQDTEKSEKAVSVEDSGTTEAVGEVEETQPIADPIEPWNRLVFFINDRLYFALIKPVAQGYGLIVPEWGRVRVRNVFDNLGTPVRFVSCLVQGKMKGAGNELVRFLLNSTVGVAGMFDVADYNLHIKSTNEDLGLALGHYGVGEGFFILWPFIGPSSLRDSVGLAGNSFLYPVNYITPFRDWLAVRSYEFENGVSLRIGEYEDLRESSLDPYVAMKDAYSEYRRNKVKKGSGEEGRTEVPEKGWPGR